ncbi:hypothetical protein SAMN05216223_102261 [Actinacidiphila yanglinensis]|uniref:Lipoprotein n=1 Tax=Actinacidiphila yanglinensis TaxID=310779 RepID=A0A1H5VDJ6_9ACTN|nr:hypothetical protein [Actinacidiphila yanglinensis]SEF85445.1 hypothetical protein SAMN05216223_102261 [Actinacidiphila yanglinensis]
MAPRTKITAAAGTLTAAALLLSACGGGGHDDKIASSPTPSATTATTTPPPTTPAASSGAPKFDLPSDVKITIDPDTTGDATKDAILRDQGYGVEAAFLAVTKQDKNFPLLTSYMSESALETWDESIDAFKKNGHSVSGTLHEYNRKVVLNGANAGVTFCEDQRYFYDKDIKTGKVLKTTLSSDDFILHTSFMRKDKDGTWKAATYTSKQGAAECVR